MKLAEVMAAVFSHIDWSRLVVYRKNDTQSTHYNHGQIEFWINTAV
jgi:hypothetical protein